MTSMFLNESAEALPQALLTLLQNCIDKTLELESFPFDASVSLCITDDAGIQALNRSHRGLDKPTDVLSFPMLAVEDGVLIVCDEDLVENRVFLGDIVISLPRAKAQAAEYGHSEARELGFLAVHATLHLLGYDHEEGQREETEMFEKQEKVLAALALFR